MTISFRLRHCMIGSSIWKYPTLFTSEYKMASSFVYVTKEERFFNKRSHRARQYQNSNKIWHLGTVFKDMYFFYFFSDKCTKDVFQNALFTNDDWTTSRSSIKLLGKFQKNICENNFARFMLKLSWPGKYPPLFTSIWVNNCSLSAQ